MKANFQTIAEAENIIDYDQKFEEIRAEQQSETGIVPSIDLLSTTACSIALKNDVDIFVCLTETGRIARFLAKYKPYQPILACTTSSSVVRQINAMRGVIGYKIPSFMSKDLKLNVLEKQGDKLLSLVLKVAKEQEMCQEGNKVLIFKAENEGQKTESIIFKLVEIK